jgi:hypothetical protein
MVVQGANDPRVNQAESDQIVIALRDRQYPVKYLVAPDEGHGFAKPINNLAMFVAVERFFETHLKGRSQADVPEDVAKKLDDLTVDPKKVTLAKKIDVSKVSELKPARALTPGVYKYAATLEMGPQKINLEIATEIARSEGGGWTVTEKMTSPMGEAVDTAVLHEGTLLLKSRTVKQGPMTIEFTSDGKNVTGKMGMNGQDRPLAAELTGGLFAETGGQFSIGALPLAAGYETVYRNFDLQKSKEKLMSVKVTGSESVTVPAGTFDAWKVEVKPEDSAGTTYWIEKSSGKPVRAKAIMPQMNGATMTLELKP